MTQLNSPALRRGARALALAGFAVGSLTAQPTVLTNENLSPGHFPALDGWTIGEVDRAKVMVEGTGLTYDVAEGRRIEGGLRSVLLNGAPAAKMNQWLVLPVDPPTGTFYFSVVFNMQNIGTEADKGELFIRFGNDWNAFFAVKLWDGIIEAAGATASFADPADTPGLVDMNHLLVGKVTANRAGQIIRVSAWLNPTALDADVPLVTQTRNHALSAIDQIQIRSQNVPTIVDNFTLGTSFSEVVPMLPADPGNITLTLPNDSDPETPGIQITGGTLFVEVDGEPYVAGTVLPVGTVVTYRVDVSEGYTLTRWNGTQLTGDEISLPVYASTNINPFVELDGDLRVILNPGMGVNPRLQLQDAGGVFRNTTRTIFDDGEIFRVVADPVRYFLFDEFRGDLEPLNATLDPFNPVANRITPGLTVGQGFIADLDELVVEGTASFTVREFAEFETEADLDPAGIALDFPQAGVTGTVPTAVMADFVAQKHAAGLGGTVTFRNPVNFGDLIADPTVDLSTPSPAGFIEYDTDGNVTSSLLPVFMAIHVLIPSRDGPLPVIAGAQGHIETGGRPNLATEDGPGERSIGESLSFAGELLTPLDVNISPGGRVPSTPPTTVGGMTSWDFEFQAEDKVVMAGLNYLSRNDFQHSNPDGDVRLWAQGVFSDGSATPVLASNLLTQSAGEHNHFAGIVAPAGVYVTNVRIWQRGGNNRAFTNADDLVVIVEGPAEATYTVSLAADPVDGGDVELVTTGDLTEGTMASATATAAEGFTFVGWEYTAAPGMIISTNAALDLTVRANVGLTAVFEEATLIGALESVLGGTVVALEEENVYISDWFGALYTAESVLPWVYSYDHGWLYSFAAAGDTEAMGWYGDLEAGLIYTTESVYPFVYVQNLEAWTFYVIGSTTPRFFFDYAAMNFIELPLSGSGE